MQHRPPTATGRLLVGVVIAALVGSAVATTVYCPKGNGVSTQETISGGWRNVNATGCPQYSPYGQSAPYTPTCQALSFRVKSNPVIRSTPTYVSRLFPNGSSNPNWILGYIGVAMNGAGVYSDVDGVGKDSYTNEGVSMDTCLGHCDATGNYHYHTNPGSGCVYNDTSGKHSSMFALMADGIPLFGPYGDNGVVPTNLDECRGHTDTTYPFYHLTSSIVAPYTIYCLKGCLYTGGPANPHLSYTDTCTQATQQYDYSTMTVPWITGLPSSQNPCAGATSPFTGPGGGPAPPGAGPGGSTSSSSSSTGTTGVPSSFTGTTGTTGGVSSTGQQYFNNINTDSGSSGLSQGAKIGIGVGVGVGGALLIVVLVVVIIKLSASSSGGAAVKPVTGV